MKINKYICAGAFAALMTAGMAAHADPGNGKGERASLGGVTVCAVEGTTLYAQARLDDQSSGNAVPVVVASYFDGLAKTGKGNWSNQFSFQTVPGDFTGTVYGSVDINASFDLCLLKGIVDDVKALNVEATIMFDRDTGGDLKTLQNMCGDDPATEMVEPMGIALTSAMAKAIASCGD